MLIQDSIKEVIENLKHKTSTKQLSIHSHNFSHRSQSLHNDKKGCMWFSKVMIWRATLIKFLFRRVQFAFCVYLTKWKADRSIPPAHLFLLDSTLTTFIKLEHQMQCFSINITSFVNWWMLSCGGNARGGDYVWQFLVCSLSEEKNCIF